MTSTASRDIQTLKIKERYGKGRIATGGKILCECGREVPHLLARCDCEENSDGEE
jgi:hypothetical protein